MTGVQTCALPICNLQTEEFPRLRLGTGNPAVRQQLGDIDFVLSKFTPSEREKLPEILRETCTKIDTWLAEKL